MKNSKVILIVLGLAAAVGLLWYFTKDDQQEDQEVDFSGAGTGAAAMAGAGASAVTSAGSSLGASASSGVDVNKVIRRGSKDKPTTKFIQRALNRVLVHQGKPTLSVDGVPGTKTIKAMKDICGFSEGSYNQVKRKVSEYFTGNGVADPYGSGGAGASSDQSTGVLSGASATTSWWFNTNALLNGLA